ncbi:MAG: DUF1015 domain-containing protein [Fimbriimonadaceae bacterium]|nr:DUF1015 domain-containing protein [Fimbriimonadaceae bacterium]
MAQIRPFRGLRFAAKAGSLDSLIAPPYDVISPTQREALAAQNEHNAVLVTLPESQDDDRSKFIKYMRSASRIADWRREGILEVEDKPTYYRYTQRFNVPGEPEKLTRTSVIVLLKTEPYEKGVVLPHEQTFPKHKEDRLRLLEATRTHVESIYGLYEDPDGSIQNTVSTAPATEVGRLTSEEDVEQIFELIQDEEVCRTFTQQLADKRLWIADGHHRYETACTFRESVGARDGIVAEDFMMMAIGSMADPGLVILPTHRIVPKLPCGLMELDQKFQAFFNTRRVPNDKLLAELKRLQAPDTRVIGVALPGGVGLLLTLDRPEEALNWIEGPESERLKLLDVSILHRVIFERLLGLSGLDFFSYTRDPDEALASAKDGGAAFLMNPPSNEDMRLIALGGEKMPQKSTYYYPKLLSGLVMWSFEDF